MLRLSGTFIIGCMVVIAASVGAVLFLLGGVRAAESLIVAAVILTGLVIVHIVSSRLHDRSALVSQISDLSRVKADLFRQIAELSRRTTALETQRDRILEAAVEKARTAAEPLATELAELGTLVKQLAETVALHELKFAKGLIEAQGGAAAEATGTAGDGATHPPLPETIEMVRSALDMNRVDLYLQPIVTLPQRRVRYYEAFTRLRGGDSTVIGPAEFLEAAEAGGLMPRIDQMLLQRSVLVVRRLQIKNREIGLFCNLAMSTLNDTQLFADILQFLDANRVLAPSLILEIKQSMLRAMGPLELESLAALRDLGFHFCMDGVTDLRIEPRELGERGIRYVKVPASLLLGAADAKDTDIHAADLSDLLARYSVSLIAERIEAEAQVVDLLEFDVRFGQGFLFSQPRPVRAEALRDTAEGGADVARDASDEPLKFAGGSGATS